MSISSRIKEARINKGLTQEQLAKIIGVTKGAVANYENQVSVPKTYVMYKLFEALDCDANYLYQDELKNNHAKNNANISPITHKFNTLNELGKQKVNDYIDDLSNNSKYNIIKSNSAKLHFKKSTKSNAAGFDQVVVNDSYAYSTSLTLQQEQEMDRLAQIIEKEKTQKEIFRNTIIKEDKEKLKRLLDAELRVKQEQEKRIDVIKKEYREAQNKDSNSDETYNLKLRLLIEEDKMAASDIKIDVLNEELKKF